MTNPILDTRQHRPRLTCRILNEHRGKTGRDYRLCGYRCAECKQGVRVGGKQ